MHVRSAEDIGLGHEEIAKAAALRTRERLYVPVKDTVCELIAGDDPAAQAAALVERLREARLVA